MNAVKGLSACQLSPRSGLPVQDGLRPGAQAARSPCLPKSPAPTLDGEVEIDGSYYGGKVRPANLKEDRVDRRLSEHQTGHSPRRGGAARAWWTHPAVRHDARKGRRRDCQADRRLAWPRSMPMKPRIGMRCTMAGPSAGSITPKPTHRTAQTPTESKATSRRLRRMVDGQHHRVSAQYLAQYAQRSGLEGGSPPAVERRCCPAHARDLRCSTRLAGTGRATGSVETTQIARTGNGLPNALNYMEELDIYPACPRSVSSSPLKKRAPRFIGC